jgi:hypothetical protein
MGRIQWIHYVSTEFILRSYQSGWTAGSAVIIGYSPNPHRFRILKLICDRDWESIAYVP